MRCFCAICRWIRWRLRLGKGERAKQIAAVEKILADVAKRGDAAVVDSCRQFDDPDFSAEQIRVTEKEMAEAAGRVAKEQLGGDSAVD